ncbi:PP2C family protein-serine/threonine phosphatase [Sessilibacter sp. MAH2]
MPLNYAAESHCGAVRTNNEDSFSADADMGLFMVADGMGGHKAGEVASAVAIYQSRRYLNEGLSLADALNQSHKDILEVGSGINKIGMGSTAVALQNYGRSYEISWVGDSRAYLWDVDDGSGRLSRLTHDHSFVQTLIDQGQISELEARHHPQRNVITQCLGNPQQDQVYPGSRTFNWKPNQWILLCSDGLTGELQDEQIAHILAGSSDLQEAVKYLMNQAIANGGHDNISIIIIETPAKATRLSKFRSRVNALFNRDKS